MTLKARKQPITKQPFLDLDPTSVYKLVRTLELEELQRIRVLSKGAPPVKFKPPLFLPKKIDYTPQIPFIRHQGAWGCHQFAQAACWDIMNELACSYSPNLSVNRLLWAFIQQVIHKQPIPGPDGKTYETIEQYMINVGCPTEGTEMTDTDGVRSPTALGDLEASNFRAKGTDGACAPQVAIGEAVSVDVNTLRSHLVKHPLRAVVFNETHFAALIGYDDTLQRFKFINSVGDGPLDPFINDDDRGFFYVQYSNLANEVQAADYREFLPPQPMPVARISFKSAFRQDVYLWLANESTTWSKRIWPNGQRQDNSRNLTITVTLPSSFAWPPSKNFPLNLEVFSTTSHINAGGDIVEFTAANGGDVMPCKQVENGPVHFEPYALTKLTIP